MPTTINPSPADIQKYLNANLLTELGMDAMTPEEAVAFFDAFGNIVWQRIVLRLNDALTDEQKEKLDTLLAKQPQDPQELGAFLMSEVSGFDQIVNEEVAGYKKELMDRMGAVNTAMGA